MKAKIEKALQFAVSTAMAILALAILTATAIAVIPPSTPTERAAMRAALDPTPVQNPTPAQEARGTAQASEVTP